MKHIDFSHKFKKQYQKLPINIQKLFDEKFRLFCENENYPSLRTKKMAAWKNIWEFSLNMNYRVTFEKNSERIFFRKVGTHDVLENP